MLNALDAPYNIIESSLQYNPSFIGGETGFNELSNFPKPKKKKQSQRQSQNLNLNVVDHKVQTLGYYYLSWKY